MDCQSIFVFIFQMKSKFAEMLFDVIIIIVFQHIVKFKSILFLR